MESKKCKQCGIEKTTDNFTKSNRGKLGVRAVCKDCVNTKRRVEDKERRKDPDLKIKKREADAAYYKANSDRIKERVSNYNETYRVNNSEKIKLTNKKYREENKEKIKAANAKWASENPHLTRAKNHRRRAREAGVEIGEHFTIVDLIERNGLSCLWCGIETTLEYSEENRDIYATVDHIIPFVRGGPHCIENAALACYRCNTLKGQKPLAEWLLYLQENKS